MLFSLTGKVATITGTGKGLGQAMTIALAEAGADIVSIDIIDATETGENVKNLSPGDCVFCIDEFPPRQMAQFINIGADKAGLIPGNPQKTEDFVPYIGEPAVCVVSAMNNIIIRPADNVAVVGTGYMSLLKIQALRYSHIDKLYCFGSDEKRLALAKECGADNCWMIDSPEGKEAIKEIIAKGGVEIVVEGSAKQSGLQLATDLVSNGGTISNFAWHRENRTVDASPWHTRGLRIINTSPVCDKHFTDYVIPTQRLFARNVFNQRRLITHVMDYHRIQEMLTISESKSDGYLKGVITF
jgi:threonine dehydrogenase-like Zn-dependent dehydrogenase